MKRTLSVRLLIGLLAAMTLLSACGGGGSAATTTAAASQATTTAGTTAAGTATEGTTTAAGATTTAAPAAGATTAVAPVGPDDAVATDELMEFSVAVQSGFVQPDSKVQKHFEEKYNVKINLVVMPTGSDLQAKVNLLMADPTQRPDVIWYNTVWTKEYIQWRDAGLLIDAAPFYHKYPNIRGYYESVTPDSIFYAAESDGRLFRIPGDVGEPGHMITHIRKDWLDHVGLGVPTTFDEFKDALRAFTADKPIEDLDAYAWMGGHSLREFMPWWSYYAVVPDNFMIQDDGTVTYGPIAPMMKEALLDIQTLYKEGVIDPMVTVMDSNTEEKRAAGKWGAMYQWIANFNPQSTMYKDFKANNPNGEFVPLEPFANPAGTESDRSISPAAWAAFSITDTAGDKAERIYAFFDAITEAPDYYVKRYGFEGEDYTYADGNYTQILAQEDNLANNIGRGLFNDFVNRKDSYNLENIPEVVAMFERGTELIQNDLKRTANLKTGERPVWNQYKADIERIRDEYMWGIIAGQRPIDDFDQMVDLIMQSGGQAAIDETQQILDAQIAEYENFWNVFKP